MRAIKPLAKSTEVPGCMGGLGGFGGFFDPKAAGFNDPVLVSGTDGVGTKLKVNIWANRNLFVHTMLLNYLKKAILICDN